MKYVSFEIAKKLKERDINVISQAWYCNYISKFENKKYLTIEFDKSNRFNDYYEFLCYAPKLSDVCDLLLEKYNFLISYSPYYVDDGSRLWSYSIGFIDDKHHTFWCKHSSSNFDSNEKAIENAIIYILENLI